MDAFRRNFKTEHEQFNGLGPFDALNISNRSYRCRFFDPTNQVLICISGCAQSVRDDLGSIDSPPDG
jgi:hypothetical protein